MFYYWVVGSREPQDSDRRWFPRFFFIMPTGGDTEGNKRGECMKKQFAWFLMLACILLAGCSDGDEVYYETNDDLLNKNGIVDVAIVFQKLEVEESTKVIYYGIRQGKDWFALFDVASGSLEKDWYGKTRDYVRPKGLSHQTSAIPYWGDRLENGDYAVVYHYEYRGESVSQLVRLLDSLDVEYGFFINDSEIYGVIVLSDNRFLMRTGENEWKIWDFEGNLIAEDVWYGKGVNRTYTGFQNDKFLVGYTDKEGDFYEVVADEPIERNRKVHLGYGEYAEFYIEDVGVSCSIETDWGYAFLPIYDDIDMYQGRFDLFLINSGKLIFVPMIHLGSEYLRNWYKNSLLVYGGQSSVVSPDGKVIAEFMRNSGLEKVEPVSYEEGIGFLSDDFNFFYRTNYVTGETVWSVSVDKLDAFASDAQKTMALVKKEGTLWSYRCDIVNKDGSKDRFEFKLDIEAGKIIY